MSLEREITLNLINPKTFSQVKHLIKKLGASTEETETKKPILNFKQKMAKDKLRAFVVFEDDSKGGGFLKKLDTFARKSRLFYVNSKPLSYDLKDSLANIASLYIDILVIYQPDLDHMKDIIEIIQTVDNRINIHVFHKDYERYLNVTTEVFISNTDILKGTSFDTVQLSSTRMLKNRVPSNAIGNAYYFVGKVALADINANTIISANRVGLFYQEDVVSEIDLETLEKLALIYVPVTNETIYSSVKANDVVNFMNKKRWLGFLKSKKL